MFQQKNETREKSGLIQYLQFNIVAVTNALIDIGTLNVLLLLWPTDESGWLVLFNSISYTLAILNSYIWNSRITFRGRGRRRTRQKVLFAGQALFSFGVSNAVFYALLIFLGWTYLPVWVQANIAKGVAMFSSSTTSFFLIRHFVFNKTADPQS